MDELTRQVGRARRRLGLQRFTAAVGWCLGAALLASAIPVGLGQYFSWLIPGWIWIAGAGAMGLTSALAWASARGRGALDAAIEIDRRFTLRERVSSALALDPGQRETESGQALSADALVHVRRIDVSGRFALRPGRSLLLPLPPAVLLTLVVWLVHAPASDPTSQAAPDAIAQVEQVRKSVDPFERELAQQREEAKKLGLQDAEELFKKLEQGAQAMSRGDLERKEAQIKLKNLADAIQARRDQLGNVDQVRQQLNQVKDVAKGPAEPLAKAVAKGDFAKAAAELDKLREALNKEKLTAEQKQDLAKQLRQMQDRINDMAKAHRDAQKSLQEQIDKLAQAGRQDEADQLQQPLDKLLRQMPRINRLWNLAQQMGQCGKCLNQGQVQDAKQALQSMAGQLQDLKKPLDEMGMLDDAMAQLDQAQQRMTCGQCNGAGCQACQGQVRQKVSPGAITGTVHGPNIKGNVVQEIQSQTSAVRQGDIDPLAEQKMPRQQRDHVREYFDKFRKSE